MASDPKAKHRKQDLVPRVAESDDDEGFVTISISVHGHEIPVEGVLFRKKIHNALHEELVLIGASRDSWAFLRLSLLAIFLVRCVFHKE